MGDGAGVARDERGARCVLGIDLGGTSMKGAFVGEDGEPVTDQAKQLTNAAAGEVAERLLAFVDQFLAPGVVDGREVVAIGVGVPGIVDESAGVGVLAVNLGWRDVPLKAGIEAATGLPTVVGHDVRSAAVGEQLYGAARGYSDFLFVSIGTGVGSAVVVNGEPYAGASYAGGEFGHMSVDARGPLCACGRRGCIEALASARAIERRYSERARDAAAVVATDVPVRIDAGDEAARRVWDDAIAALAAGILNYMTLLDPEAIVIGGGLAPAGDRLLVPLREAIDTGLSSFQSPRPVVLGALPGTAGWRGAAAQAWQLVEARRGSGGGPP